MQISLHYVNEVLHHHGVVVPRWLSCTSSASCPIPRPETHKKQSPFFHDSASCSKHIGLQFLQQF